MIEERRRHIKCFWNIADFPSTDFALVANQVVFTDNDYACFDTYDYTRMVMAVPESARARLSSRLNQRRRELYQGN